MGLDMYITKETYVGANYEHNHITGTINLKKKGEKIPIKRKRVTYVIEEVAYWRKAHALHNWFVCNIQGGKDECEKFEFTLKQLEPLVELLGELKAKIPRGADNFATVYSDGEEWLVCDIRYTIKVIKALAKEGREYFNYQASW